MARKSLKPLVIEKQNIGSEATDELILEIWKQAWDDSDKTFPFTVDIDARLSDLKVCTHVLEARIVNLSKKVFESLDAGEQGLVAFYNRTKNVSRMVLLQNLSKHPPGQIHVARTIFGLEPNQKHEIKETRKLSDALKDGDGTV